jgi:hypothetical protein
MHGVWSEIQELRSIFCTMFRSYSHRTNNTTCNNLNFNLCWPHPNAWHYLQCHGILASFAPLGTSIYSSVSWRFLNQWLPWGLLENHAWNRFAEYKWQHVACPTCISMDLTTQAKNVSQCLQQNALTIPSYIHYLLTMTRTMIDSSRGACDSLTEQAVSVCKDLYNFLPSQSCMLSWVAGVAKKVLCAARR